MPYRELSRNWHVFNGLIYIGFSEKEREKGTNQLGKQPVRRQRRVSLFSGTFHEENLGKYGGKESTNKVDKMRSEKFIFRTFDTNLEF